MLSRAVMLVCVLMLTAAAAGGRGFADATAQTLPTLPPGATGLPVPRFVSLKSDRVNLRQGPGTEYPTAWVYRRIGMPVEIIREFDGWRQIRDQDGTTGWVLGSMLSGRRTVVVLPWESKGGAAPKTVPLRDDDSESARTVAHLEPGVMANVVGCDGRWCRLSVGDLRGYMEQKMLWGVQPGEIVK